MDHASGSVSTGSAGAEHAAASPIPDLGVLFVHGIGEQRPGHTLLQHAGNLVRWIERRSARGGPDMEAQIDDVRLVGADVAHMLMQLRVGDERSRVLLAESYWADQFIAPSGRQVLAWLRGVAPVLIVVRIVEVVGTAWRRWWSSPLQWWRIGVAAGLAVLAIPATWLVLLLLLVSLTLRAVVPVKAVRQALARAETLMTQILGDSHAFAADPVQRAALISTVRRDLRWLQARTAAQVVIAHSQGAAVSLEVLSNEVPSELAKPCTLVTLGSGARTLGGLRATRPDDARFASAASTIGFAAATAYLVIAYLVVVGSPIPDLLSAVMGLGGWYWAPIGIGWTLLAASRAAGRGFASASSPCLPTVLCWRDFVGTADPVTGHWRREEGNPALQSFAVRNRNNVLTDHSAYVRNEDEYWPRVVAMLIDHLPGGPEHGRRPAARQLDAVADLYAPYRHRQGRWQVAIRVVGLAVAAVAAVAAVSGSTAALPPLSIGVRLRSALAGTGLPEVVVTWVAADAVLLALVNGLAAFSVTWVTLTLVRWGWESAELQELVGGGRRGSGSTAPGGATRGMDVLALTMVAVLSGAVLAAAWRSAVVLAVFGVRFLSWAVLLAMATPLLHPWALGSTRPRAASRSVRDGALLACVPAAFLLALEGLARARSGAWPDLSVSVGWLLGVTGVSLAAAVYLPPGAWPSAWRRLAAARHYPPDVLPVPPRTLAWLWAAGIGFLVQLGAILAVRRELVGDWVAFVVPAMIAYFVLAGWLYLDMAEFDPSWVRAGWVVVGALTIALALTTCVAAVS